jgi:hypothetical protein
MACALCGFTLNGAAARPSTATHEEGMQGDSDKHGARRVINLNFKLDLQPESWTSPLAVTVCAAACQVYLGCTCTLLVVDLNCA